MTQEHPITPPPELVRQWATSNGTHYEDLAVLCGHVAARAAQWGADQELEACCEWIPKATPWDAEQLRVARRPKPPSLKEQALKALDHILNNSSTDLGGNTIRRALEQLDD
jgi:hypothetical protein